MRSFTLCKWSSTLSEKHCKPQLVEWGVHPRCVPQHRGPQVLRLGPLVLGHKAAGREHRLDKPLEQLGARVVNASLPVLDRAAVGTYALRQLTLGQSGPP